MKLMCHYIQHHKHLISPTPSVLPITPSRSPTQPPRVTHHQTITVTNTATLCLSQQYVSKEPPYTIIVTNTATSCHSHTITSYTINVTDTTTFTSHMNTFAPSPTQPPHVTRTITYHKQVNPMPLAPLLPSLTLWHRCHLGVIHLQSPQLPIMMPFPVTITTFITHSYTWDTPSNVHNSPQPQMHYIDTPLSRGSLQQLHFIV